MPAPPFIGPAPELENPIENEPYEATPLTELLGLDADCSVVEPVPIELEELELVEQPPELPLTPV
jgi:hypothetical protein